MIRTIEPDRPALEIEITPDMVDAGVSVYRKIVGFDGASVYADADVITLVLRAALSPNDEITP